MTDVRELIIDLVQSKLKDITIANGFNQDVQNVLRAGTSAESVREFITILIHDLGDDRLFEMAQLAHERTLNLQLQVVGSDYEDEDRAEIVNQALGDLEKQVHANEFWNDGSVNLAVSTRQTRSGPSIGEAQSPIGTDRLAVDIVYRTTLADPEVIATF